MTDDRIVVSDLWIFPIKSCRGTQLRESAYTVTGLEYDRNWMIVDARTHVFLTARTLPKMVLIHPTIDNSTSSMIITIPLHGSTPASTHSLPLVPEESSIHDYDFTIWGTSSLDGYLVGSSQLLEALSSFLGREVHIVQKGNDTVRLAGPDEGWIELLQPSGLRTEYDEPSSVNWPDQFPLSLLSKASLNRVDEMIMDDPLIREQKGFDVERWNGTEGCGVEVQRFRGNIIVDGIGLLAWEEEGWGEIRLVPAESSSGGSAGVDGEGEGTESKRVRGEETMFVATRLARCMLPNVAVEGAQAGIRDKCIPDSVLRPRETFEGRITWPSLMPDKVCFGMNLVPKASKGMVKVGDTVHVIRRYEADGIDRFIRPEDSFPSFR